MRAALPTIAFVRLTQIPAAAIAAHMSDPRVATHLPLAPRRWDASFCAAFVAAKEACWERDGLGYWAILADGCYVGWGGFQREDDEWDFGLVLRPDRFGLGPRIVATALAYARRDPRIAHVTLLLPPSRRRLRALERLGAHFVGIVDHRGHMFRKYRVDTA